MFYSNNLKKNNQIQHCFFSRNNGNSQWIYESLNCGIVIKDKKENVQKNLELVVTDSNVMLDKFALNGDPNKFKVFKYLY